MATDSIKSRQNSTMKAHLDSQGGKEDVPESDMYVCPACGGNNIFSPICLLLVSLKKLTCALILRQEDKDSISPNQRR